ncbi:MAG: hypothetical protein PUC11_05135, partial [Elusimicrobia bacterium]|nr:hypothetical protein [Elusimicrobiota bacterium]
SRSSHPEQEPQTPSPVSDSPSLVEFIEKALMNLLLGIAALTALIVLAAVVWFLWLVFSSFGFIGGLGVLLILGFVGVSFLLFCDTQK